MLLDPAFLWENLGLVVAVAGAVLVLKAAVAALSARLLGSPLGVALAVGLALAQIGEFSFVLALAGAEVGLVPGGVEAGGQMLIAVTVLLMLATPGLVALGPRLASVGRRVEDAASAATGGAGHGHRRGPRGPHGRRRLRARRAAAGARAGRERDPVRP